MKALVNNKSLNNNIELLRISSNFKHIRWIKYRGCLTSQMYIIIERNKNSLRLHCRRKGTSKVRYPIAKIYGLSAKKLKY